MTPIVSFVSSGPGDPDLLTMKAIKRIKSADLIFYDDLSAGEILELAAESTTLFSVGKRAGLNSPKQSQVSTLLVNYGKTGKKIVRLKSGDSGIFSRLEEEIVALEKNNIPFEIIPGVSSANAAAAAAKIPLTRRLHSITGHDFNGNLPDDLQISSLTDSSSTTVIFMGKKTFPNLCNILLESGMDKNTHALVVENVSRSDEKVTKGSIVDISEYLQDNISNDPAIIIFGSVI